MGSYTVQLDDTPATIAKKLTGDPSRMGELIAANPQKATQNVQGMTTFQTLKVGETLAIPERWSPTIITLDSSDDDTLTQVLVGDEVRISLPIAGGSSYEVSRDGNAVLGAPTTQRSAASQVDTYLVLDVGSESLTYVQDGSASMMFTFDFVAERSIRPIRRR